MEKPFLCNFYCQVKGYCSRYTNDKNSMYCKKHLNVRQTPKFISKKNYQRFHCISHCQYKHMFPRDIINLIKSYDFNMNSDDLCVINYPLSRIDMYSYVTASKIISDKLFITGSNKGVLLFWNLNNGLCIKTLKAHSQIINDIIVLENIDNFCNKKIVSCSSDGNAKIWDTNTFECENIVDLAHKEILVTKPFLTKTAQNILISGTGDGSIIIWQINSNEYYIKEIIQTEHYDFQGGAMFIDMIIDDTNEYPIIVSACESYDDLKIKLWKKSSSNTLYTKNQNVIGHNSRITNVICKNKMIYSSSFDLTIKIWNSDGALVFILPDYCPISISSHKCAKNFLILENGDVIYGARKICQNVFTGIIKLFQISKHGIINCNAEIDTLFDLETNNCFHIDYLPDNQLIISIGNNIVKIFDLNEYFSHFDNTILNDNNIMIDLNNYIQDLDMSKLNCQAMTEFICQYDKIISVHNTKIIVWK